MLGLLGQGVQSGKTVSKPAQNVTDWSVLLQTAHYRPVAKFALDIRAPTSLDPLDVWRPALFSNCTVPLIFQPHYFSIYAEFFL